jgi:catechol 2,3-dioxygenase-like lactoylglutathione lyase family enzyme
MAISAIVAFARLARQAFGPQYEAVAGTLIRPFPRRDGVMIKAMKFVSVPVRDQQRALDFYTQVLGFRVVTDQPFSDEQRWIELGVGRSGTGITLFTPPGHESRIGTFTGISLLADDVEATYRELSAKGVVFLKEPQKADWGTSAIFADPDGNQFVLGDG